MWRRTERLFSGAVLVAVIYGSFIARDSAQVLRDRHTPETFPFFRWSLFSTVTGPDYTVFTLRFSEMDGVSLDPVYLQESMIPDRSTTEMQALVGRLAEAIARRQGDDIGHLRAILESRYLYPLDSAHYEVVEQRISLERWRSCKCSTTETVLAEFTMAQR